MRIFIRQFLLLIRHGFRMEMAEPQRWLSSLLFAVTILFLFSFAIGELPSAIKPRLLLAELFLSCFLVLQLVHQRILAAEEEDNAFDVLTTYSVSFSTLYLVKVILAFFLSVMVIGPFFAIMQLMHNMQVLDPTILGVAGLVIMSLSALGVLLSRMTQSATGRELLFPILYFPLSIPILLAAVQASFCYWQIDNPESLYLWFGLLGGLCIIFLTLGILLFEELFGMD